MAGVTLRSVDKVFPGGVKAVSDMNLEIQDGEFIVLVGPSGCGKTSSLRMIAGLEEISAGEILIGDRVVNDVPPKDRDIAMVFQNYALYPHMTVRDNMAFGLKLRKFPKAEIRSRIEDAAEVLGLTELLDRRPKELSGGQRQRVAVGRAIVRQPQVFLFDEPLSNLDAKLRVQMRVEISQLHARLKTTMIYVTHDQVEAMTMGDRIVVMKDGVVQQVADPVTLYDKPVNRMVAGFIGMPPMNFFEGTIEADGDALVFVADGVRLRVPEHKQSVVKPYMGRSLTLGLRPEHIGSPTAEQDAQAQRLSAVAEVIEPMGAETYVYGRSGSALFVSRMDPHKPVAVGGEIAPAVMMDHAHFFDPETEVAL